MDRVSPDFVFAFYEVTTEELGGLFPFPDVDSALEALGGFIEARVFDPSHEFQLIEVGTVDRFASSGVSWHAEPVLRALVRPCTDPDCSHEHARVPVLH